jgi:hypothetical protein
MSRSRSLLGLLAVAAIAIPGAALAMGGGPNPPSAAKAYGVICKREPYNAKPSTPEFRKCVTALAKGTKGTKTASDAARVTCRQATPPLSGKEFGKCVSSTKTLVQGLQAIRAQ